MSDVAKAYEMEVIFYSGKTFGPEHAEARNCFAIEDENDPRCLIRNTARLWLLSDRCKEYHVFGWANVTKGVRRTFVNKMLKEQLRSAACHRKTYQVTQHE